MIYRLFAVCMIVLGFLLPAAAQDVRARVREGLQLLRTGDADAALAVFRDAQVEEPESARLNYNVGLALYRAERFDEAEKAFRLATVTSEPEIEKRARLQGANCAIKTGRYEEALDALNRALEVDANYAEARANREWVIRKMAELARKKKDQQEKREQERRFIEKLQEIVGAQTQAHLATRMGMKRRGLELRPTRIKRLDEVLDAPLAPSDDAAEPMGDDEEGPFFETLAKAQVSLREKTTTLIAEGRTKVEETRAAGGAPTPGGVVPPSPPGGQAGPAPIQDPQIAAIERALPILDRVQPLLERAEELAAEGSWNLQGIQEEALGLLLKALDELLDELMRIIQDEVQLVKDTARLGREVSAAANESEVDPNAGASAASGSEAEGVRDRATELSLRQVGLRERTGQVAKAIEGQVQGLNSGAGAGGTPVGQDPEAQATRLKAALDHLLAATGHMEAAESDLGAVEIAAAAEDENLAVQELVKARAALQPPQENSGERGDQGEQKEDKKSDEGEDGQDENKQKGEDKDDSDQNQGQQSEDAAQDEGKGEGEKKPEGQEGKERQMSPEQAKRMLERAAQRERDRRAENKDKGRRLKGGGARGGKDW